jgi:hypothetical protein
MRPSTRTVTVVPDGPANLTGWGFKWPVAFQLSDSEPELGWIVQKVSIRFQTWTEGRVFHYDKILLAGGEFLDKPAPDPDLGEEKSRGEVKVVGTVAFYLGELPASFNEQRKASSGVLPSTTTEPDFWTGNGTAHNLIATWDTLSGKGLFRLQMTPTPQGIERFKPKNVNWNEW